MTAWTNLSKVVARVAASSLTLAIACSRSGLFEGGAGGSNGIYADGAGADGNQGGGGGGAAGGGDGGGRSAAGGWPSGGTAGGTTGGDDSRAPFSDASVNVPDAHWTNPRDPFCPGMGATENVDVWADDRGVFVLINTQSSTRIFQNSGADWTTVFDTPALGPTSLSGFPDGPLVVYGSVLCGLRFVEDGRDSCSAGFQDASGFFAVSGDRAYATHRNTVLQFDGTLWTQFGQGLETTAGAVIYAPGLWADENSLLVGTDVGVFSSDPSGELKLDSSLPYQRYWAVWASPDGQSWAGAADGLWWGSGGVWTRIWETGSDCRESVRKIWGTGQSVFFLTGRTLGVHRGGGEVEILREWPCEPNFRLRGLWGRSDTEVYVTAYDSLRSTSACGEGVLFLYDGEHVREL